MRGFNLPNIAVQLAAFCLTLLGTPTEAVESETSITELAARFQGSICIETLKKIAKAKSQPLPMETPDRLLERAVNNLPDLNEVIQAMDPDIRGVLSRNSIAELHWSDEFLLAIALGTNGIHTRFQVEDVGDYNRIILAIDMAIQLQDERNKVTRTEARSFALAAISTEALTAAQKLAGLDGKNEIQVETEKRFHMANRKPWFPEATPEERVSDLKEKMAKFWGDQTAQLGKIEIGQALVSGRHNETAARIFIQLLKDWHILDHPLVKAYSQRLEREKEAALFRRRSMLTLQNHSTADLNLEMIASREHLEKTYLEHPLFWSGNWVADLVFQEYFAAFIESLSEDPAIRILKPRKKAIYGDFLIVSPELRLGVFLDKLGNIQSLRLLPISEPTVEQLWRAEKAMSEAPLSFGHKAPTSQLTTPAPMKTKPDLRQQSRALSPISSQREISWNLQGLDEGLRSLLETKYLELWKETQGSDEVEFLELSQILLQDYSGIRNAFDLPWFISKVRQINTRQDLNSEMKIDLLSKDIDRYMRRKSALFSRDIVEFERLHERSNTLEAFIEGKREIDTLVPEQVYSLQMNDMATEARIRMSSEVVKFLKEDRFPLQWMRALRKGPQAQHSPSGLIEFYSLKGVTHELKIRRTGKRMRIATRLEEDGTWTLLYAFELKS